MTAGLVRDGAPYVAHYYHSSSSSLHAQSLLSEIYVQRLLLGIEAQPPKQRRTAPPKLHMVRMYVRRENGTALQIKQKAAPGLVLGEDFSDRNLEEKTEEKAVL